jgi:2,3-bisphosphoglycerate-dependent phosphoglycerate mutase
LIYKVHLLLLCRYGELQGLNKKETADKFGADKVHEWRRSYDIPPPNGESLEMCAERAVKYFVENVRPVTYHPCLSVLTCEIQTNCTSFSSLKSSLLSNFTVAATWWQVVPELAAGKSVMIAAHGNSLRAIIMYLDKLTSQQVGA